MKDFMEARSNSIQDAFDSAEAVNRRADEKMENYNRRIANVEPPRTRDNQRSKDKGGCAGKRDHRKC